MEIPYMQINLHENLIHEFSLKHAILYGLVEVWFERLEKKGVRESFLPMKPFNRFGIGGSTPGKMFKQFCEANYLYRELCPKTKKWIYSRSEMEPIKPAEKEETVDVLR